MGLDLVADRDELEETPQPQADSGPNAAAAGNWMWLTGLTRADTALYVGDASHALCGILERQFQRVVILDRGDPHARAALTDLPDGSFDYIALPGVLEWWPGGPDDLFRSAVRLLRPGGWMGIATNNPYHRAPRRAGTVSRIAGGLAGVVAAIVGRSHGAPFPGRIERALRRAGFSEIRTYGVEPAYSRPLMVVPRTRAAALACEWGRSQQLPVGPLRTGLAALGFSDLLYGAWLFLATP